MMSMKHHMTRARNTQPLQFRHHHVVSVIIVASSAAICHARNHGQKLIGAVLPNIELSKIAKSRPLQLPTLVDAVQRISLTGSDHSRSLVKCHSCRLVDPAGNKSLSDAVFVQA